MNTDALVNSIDERIRSLEEKILSIEQRNARVETDKAWETSYYRIITMCALTYITASALLYMIGAQRPLIDALVPVAGFFLSTRSLPAIKASWVKRKGRE